MTDLERNNLRRAMYSREAARTEEDEEGEKIQETTIRTVTGLNANLVIVTRLLLLCQDLIFNV